MSETALIAPSAPQDSGAVTSGDVETLNSPAGVAAPDLVSGGEGAATPEAVTTEDAFERAQRKLSERAAPAEKEGAPPPPAKDLSDRPGQAAKEYGDSTPTDDPSTDQSDTGATGDPLAAGDSTAEPAPQDWPKGLRETYDALPPEARQGLRQAHADMQAGFTKAMQQVATERRSLPERAQNLLSLAEAFDSDPQATLTQLAEQKGLKLRFGDGAAEAAQDTPEFESAADLAKWAATQAKAEVERTLESMAEQQSAAQRSADAESALHAELRQAEQLPGWGQYREPTLSRLANNPNLSVQEAYDLETLPALRKLAEQAASAQAELAALKKANENRNKRSLTPVGGNGAGREAEQFGDMTPTEIAMERAAKKLAQRRSAS